MILRLLRLAFRFLTTLVLLAAAGVIGWIAMGWMHGQPPSLEEQWRQEERRVKATAQKSAATGEGTPFARVLSARSGEPDTALFRLAEWAATASVEDLQAMQEALHDQGGKGMNLGFLSGILRSRTDLAWQGDSVYTANVLRTWSAGDRTGCLAAIDDLPPHLRSKIPTRLLKLAALAESESALKMLTPYLSAMVPTEGIRATVGEWASKDAAGALAFARTFQPGESRTLALKGIIDRIAASNPLLGLQILAELPPEDRSDAAQRAYQSLSASDGTAAVQRWEQFAAHNPDISPFAGLADWYGKDRQAAMNWLAQHPAVNFSRVDVVDQGELVRESKLSFLAQIAQSRGGGEKAAILGELQIGLMFSAVPLEWARGQADPEIRAAALLGYVGRWSELGTAAERIAAWKEAQQLDPARAAQTGLYWLRQIGAEDPSLVAEVIPTLTPHQQSELLGRGPEYFTPAAAMGLTFRIQDIVERERMEQVIVGKWGATQPAEVRQWIETLPTEQERSAMRRLMEWELQK